MSDASGAVACQFCNGDLRDHGNGAAESYAWQAALAEHKSHTPSDAYEALPLCPSGCGCRVGSDDPDRHDCACDGPCCTWTGEVVRYVHPDDRPDASGD